jgi:plastocyanin
MDLTGSGTARIVLRDFAFDPVCSVVETDQGLSLPNEGEVEHNFSLEGPDIDLDVAAGDETNTEAIGGMAEPGTYALFCKIHRGAGMEGEVRIQASS